MRIDFPGAGHPYTPPRTQAQTSGNANAASFVATMASLEANNGVQRADFTSMTRQDLSDWMNREIRSGRMSLDESSAFLGMTMKISVATGQPVDMATDTARIDFTQRVRDGIEGARSRNDATSLKMLETAMQIMQQHAGRAIGVDLRA